ncbi:MAG: HAMP domain-containing protein [Coriobacteriales bacterium]|nr:HAMP domain-containing protein [Coriobacteriales bacterium]
MLRLFSGFSMTGLRARLLGVVLLAVVPLSIILIAYAGIQNSAEQERARAVVQRGLQSDIRAIQDLVSESRATLVTFGITYAIQAQRWDIVQGNSERLVVENPEYEVVAVSDPEGRVRASSLKRGVGVDISDEPLVRNAIASKRLVVSNLRADPLTGRPSIAVALPAYDDEGRLLAVQYIGFDPERFAGRLSSAGGASVETLVDGTGTLIARRPEVSEREARAARRSELVRSMLEGDRGEATVRGLDGVEREYVYAPVFGDPAGRMFLSVGYSPSQLLAQSDRTFRLILFGFTGFALLALAAAWLLGTYSIYRPALLLSRATERFSAGDLSARADLGSPRDEFGALERDFNEMATTLQEKVEELEATRTALGLLNAELEDRVRRRTSELEASVQELEAFSYSVSHDLRSPLRAIDGFSAALIEDYWDTLDEQGRDDLGRVRDNARRMGELIDSLLKLSRFSRQEMKLQDVDLSCIASDVAEFLQHADPERSVTFEIAPDVYGQGDPSLLRVVIDNLMSNAWKFTSKRPSATIEFGSREQDGQTVYFVKDDGAGFDMAYASKLFGAFQRVHGQAEFPGIGIGLATSARIVHRHGGRIWAEGEPEKGATFSFTLS